MDEVICSNQQAQIEVVIIWIEMLEEDDESTVRKAAELFKNQPVIQFHDPNRLAGRAIAESLGAEGVIAWDMYLFYSKGSRWETKPPAPFDWVHQLNDAWTDKNHFAWGEELRKRLQEIVGKIIQ